MPIHKRMMGRVVSFFGRGSAVSRKVGGCSLLVKWRCLEEAIVAAPPPR